MAKEFIFIHSRLIRKEDILNIVCDGENSIEVQLKDENSLLYKASYDNEKNRSEAFWKIEHELNSRDYDAEEIKVRLERIERQLDGINEHIRAYIPQPQKPDENLLIPINALNMPSRPRNSLLAENIKNIGELLKWTERNLLKIPNFGSKSMSELKEALAEHGYSLSKK